VDRARGLALPLSRGVTPRPTRAATPTARGTDEASYPTSTRPFTGAGWQIPVNHLMVEEAGIAAAFAVRATEEH
jgi:hypothetical protein